ncbi:DUF3127 domain-containing protein [Spirosoma sp. HMF3257]|uniref:DUF3127 domain-containing protein n=1 Tax=Spirosoma telluris TaxID=2183553 RepID=A0A327NDQ9_9BACT|nr:DUF3127 domain-containing protein [Spirosoma telluris]RAI73307.1 hypothetical protein HMF3257_00625 [Spirosoma telluris]
MSNQLTVTGKFLAALATEAVGQNNFLVRKFYVDLTENPDYPNTPEFQLTGDKVALVENLQRGQTVQVKFSIDGRKVRNKTTGKESVITNLKVWKIDVLTTQSAAVATPVAPRPAPAPAPAISGPGQYAQQQASTGEQSDDLPF